LNEVDNIKLESYFLVLEFCILYLNCQEIVIPFDSYICKLFHLCINAGFLRPAVSLVIPDFRALEVYHQHGIEMSNILKSQKTESGEESLRGPVNSVYYI
jgi:hypothetical protein